MRKGLALSVIGVAVALIALLVFGVSSQGTDTSIDEAVADGTRLEAPVATLPELGGENTGSLADYKGQVVVLNFWASWCPPCVDELPLLEQTQRSIESSHATVLGVNYRDIPEDALEFADDYGLTYPSFRDTDGEYAERFSTLGYPETFVIDRSGKIAAVRRGPVDQAWLDETLPPLLAEES